MEKSREEFIVFIRQALHDRTSGAYEELYRFLCHCFTRADTHMTGRVSEEQFDILIEAAAALPRLYGFAPKTIDMYPTIAQRKEGRAKLFNSLDTKGYKSISLGKWITYAMDHIEEKVKSLPKDYLGASNEEVTMEEFIAFIQKAVDKSTPEYQELYHFLIKTFEKGDTDRCGTVSLKAFDLMIEDAAEAPRRFGLHESYDSMSFSDAKARFAERREYFHNMDRNKNGSISLDDWIAYAHDYIFGKVSELKFI